MERQAVISLNHSYSTFNGGDLCRDGMDPSFYLLYICNMKYRAYKYRLIFLYVIKFICIFAL